MSRRQAMTFFSRPSASLSSSAACGDDWLQAEIGATASAAATSARFMGPPPLAAMMRRKIGTVPVLAFAPEERLAHRSAPEHRPAAHQARLHGRDFLGKKHDPHALREGLVDVIETALAFGNPGARAELHREPRRAA